MISGSAKPAIHSATLATIESTSEPHCEDTLLPFRSSANCCLKAATKTPIGAAIAASDLIQVTAIPPTGPPIALLSTTSNICDSMKGWNSKNAITPSSTRKVAPAVGQCERNSWRLSGLANDCLSAQPKNRPTPMMAVASVSAKCLI